jgi:hypothetical protein
LFGARESVLDVSLSPSGNKLAYLAPGPGQSTHLYTVDLAAGGTPRLAGSADGKPERLADCGWVSDTRLACTVFAVAEDSSIGVIGATRLIALDADGKNLKLLSRPTPPDDAYVSFRRRLDRRLERGRRRQRTDARQYVPRRRWRRGWSTSAKAMRWNRIDSGQPFGQDH